MATVTFILGESGTGKSTSMENLDPANTLLIQSIRKRLPFKSTKWGYLTRENQNGNVLCMDDARKIIDAMRRTRRPIIVIDDAQYIMANAFMRRSEERGFDKFTEIGRDMWEIITAANDLPEHVRVYVLSHVETSDDGRTKMKTIGKMLDEKICLEGMVTIVLKTDVLDHDYRFITQNNGRTTCKSPKGMFESDSIPNDLAAVDNAICDFYDIHATA
ncbi:AAA family ATPase [Burkholderia vietnamiensis]|uniref:AAA family ATPase n=1 Tax=Burkholderia vietnamiensis TaxID=60552 RepID=UPI001CF568CB|nr:AAA family ATPase [Burkholderia vietnamiensis]MCA8013353.1 ATP-binding protein [Burkholderia vietnamiensis]MCA8266462.1 ATP-binding protein [Burkholderia vietnamiensis]